MFSAIFLKIDEVCYIYRETQAVLTGYLRQSLSIRVILDLEADLLLFYTKHWETILEL